MIVVVDYGMGNVGSIINMLQKIEVDGTLSGDPRVVASADRLILPGVGAFDRGMTNLHERSLVAALGEAVLERRRPILGICLGMQLLSRSSEEGVQPGLGWLPADTRRFRFPEHGERRAPRVPQMGWNEVRPAPASRLLGGWEGEARFYFVHSYHVVPDDPSLVTSLAHYGYDFAAAIEREHVMGVQFHPEKSHSYGMRLLQRFDALT